MSSDSEKTDDMVEKYLMILAIGCAQKIYTAVLEIKREIYPNMSRNDMARLAHKTTLTVEHAIELEFSRELHREDIILIEMEKGIKNEATVADEYNPVEFIEYDELAKELADKLNEIDRREREVQKREHMLNERIKAIERDYEKRINQLQNELAEKDRKLQDKTERIKYLEDEIKILKKKYEMYKKMEDRGIGD